MVWKKVVNSDPGDADHYGGDDLDKVSDLFSGVDVDDIVMNADFAFKNGKLQKQNPAGTFTLTEIHPAISANKERRAYQAYNYLVFQEGSTWYAKNGLTEAIDSSNANATIVIQYAIDNLTGSRTQKEVVKVVGSPSVTKITFPSYTVLDGTAAKFFLANATNTPMFENVDTTLGNTDIEIYGGIYDGNRTNQSTGTETRSLFRFVACSNVNIHHIKLMNSINHGIRLNDCPTGITVCNNTIADWVEEGISDEGLGVSSGVCHHHIISNNYLYHTVAVAGNTHIATVNISDLVCSGNTCQTNTAGSGITFNGLRNVIAFNTVTDIVGAGIVLAQGTSSIFDSSGSIVIGNIVKNCGATGIHIQNGYDGRDYTVANNFVDNTGTLTPFNGTGILVQDQFNTVIVGNVVKNSGGSGIKLTAANVNAGSKHGIISNNLCYNNGIGLSATDSHRAGICIESDTAGFLVNVNVHGNNCYDDQGTQTQKYGIRTNKTNDCVIKNNDIRLNLTAAMLITTDSGSKISGNMGWVTENSGSSTQSGDGTTKIFNIAHGLTAAPTKYVVSPGSADALGPPYLTSDATNVIVTYPTAPASGTSNLIFRWIAEVV